MNTAHSGWMIPYATDLDSLDRHECLHLLDGWRVGRIIYTADALPAIDVVPYRLHDDTIMISATATTLRPTISR
jgi:hypothetical protein